MESSFKFQIVAYGSTLTVPEQRARVDEFAYTALRGPIDLKNPETTFVLAEDYGLPTHPLPPAPVLRHVYFGLFIGTGNRDARQIFDLKKRAYLGTTSMDPELSLVMSNMCLVKPSSFVLDPFVGTGSLLLTASHFGAFLLGCDIDGRQIRGGLQGEVPRKGELKDILRQYNCEKVMVDSVVCDAASHPWRGGGWWDAVVADVRLRAPRAFSLT